MTQSTITPASPQFAAPRNGFGVAALVLGIVGAVFSWVPVLGFILAVLAVVFGGLGYARARKGEATNSGMAIAGLILGVIAFVIQISVFAAVGSAVNSAQTASPDATDQKLEQLRKEWMANPAALAPMPASAPAPPAPAGPLSSFGAGTYEISKDVESGTYRTAGPSGSFPCYWARLKDTNGEFDSIIANGNPTGPTTVTLKSSDAAFETSGGCTWTKVR